MTASNHKDQLNPSACHCALQVSVENGLIVTRSIKRPLIIDPQQQCSRWIRVREAGAGLITTRASDPNLLRVVEGAVRLGTPLLIDDMPEGSLPPGLEGLLATPQQHSSATSADTRTGGRAVGLLVCRLAALET